MATIFLPIILVLLILLLAAVAALLISQRRFEKIKVETQRFNEAFQLSTYALINQLEEIRLDLICNQKNLPEQIDKSVKLELKIKTLEELEGIVTYLEALAKQWSYTANAIIDDNIQNLQETMNLAKEALESIKASVDFNNETLCYTDELLPVLRRNIAAMPKLKSVQ